MNNKDNVHDLELDDNTSTVLGSVIVELVDSQGNTRARAQSKVHSHFFKVVEFTPQAFMRRVEIHASPGDTVVEFFDLVNNTSHSYDYHSWGVKYESH